MQNGVWLPVFFIISAGNPGRRHSVMYRNGFIVDLGLVAMEVKAHRYYLSPRVYE
jgi:hypothetical protein